MDTKNMISFLLNSSILNPKDFFSEEFSIERKVSSNYVFNLNIRSDLNQHKNIIKVKKDINNLGDKLLLREAFFYHFFLKDKDKLGFSELPSTSDIKPKGLFQNNSIFVRDFVEDYNDGLRILLKDKNCIDDIITNTASTLAKFHQFKIGDSLYRQFAKYLNKAEINVNPIAISEIPPLSDFKFAPEYIQQFWKVLNESKEVLEDTAKELRDLSRKNQGLVHGDLRLSNILFQEKDDTFDFTQLFFIDYEYWHVGDVHWDIMVFFFDLQQQPDLHFDISDLKSKFLKAYESDLNKHDTILDKINLMESLFIIQNIYSELTAENFNDSMIVLNIHLEQIKELKNKMDSKNGERNNYRFKYFTKRFQNYY